MRQVFWENGLVNFREVAQPVIDDFSILVSVNYSFITNDFEITKILSFKKNIFSNVPEKIKSILGISSEKKLQYSLNKINDFVSGKVIAVGKKVMNFREGDLVACFYTSAEVFTDIICVTENLAINVSDESFLKEASLVGVGSFALQSIRKAELQIGEYVCIFGLDIGGIIFIQLAKLSGCKVLSISSRASDLELAKKAGADLVYLLNDNNLKQSIDFWTNHQGLDCAIITSHITKKYFLKNIASIMRNNGKIILNGVNDLNYDFNLNKEVELIISNSPGPGHYDWLYEQKGQEYPYAYVRWTKNRNMQAFLDLIENNKLKLKEFIKDEFNLNDLEKAYSSFQDSSYLGAFVNFIMTQKKTLTFTPAIKEIGYTSNKIEIINSAHHLHCDHAIQAIKKHNPVFVKRPMATSQDQLKKIMNILIQKESVPFCVEYERSFSPVILKIKKEVEKRQAPMIIHYTVNNRVLKENWLDVDSDSGKILLEASDIIDVFCYLTNSKPISVSVESLNAKRDDIFPTDNFTVQISFLDGSVCSLLYTSIGGNHQNNEKMEVYFDGKTIVMENYMSLVGFGLNKKIDCKLSSPNKGGGVLFEQFNKETEKQIFVSPISLERLYIVAKLSLIIDQLVCDKGGEIIISNKKNQFDFV